MAEKKLKKFHYLFHSLVVLLGLLSFGGFVLAYASGVIMGAAFFLCGYKTSFLIGAIWSIMLPLIVSLYKRVMDIK